MIKIMFESLILQIITGIVIYLNRMLAADNSYIMHEIKTSKTKYVLDFKNRVCLKIKFFRREKNEIFIATYDTNMCIYLGS